MVATVRRPRYSPDIHVLVERTNPRTAHFRLAKPGLLPGLHCGPLHMGSSIKSWTTDGVAMSQGGGEAKDGLWLSLAKCPARGTQRETRGNHFHTVAPMSTSGTIERCSTLPSRRLRICLGSRCRLLTSASATMNFYLDLASNVVHQNTKQRPSMSPKPEPILSPRAGPLSTASPCRHVDHPGWYFCDTRCETLPPASVPSLTLNLSIPCDSPRASSTC